MTINAIKIFDRSIKLDVHSANFGSSSRIETNAHFKRHPHMEYKIQSLLEDKISPSGNLVLHLSYGF